MGRHLCALLACAALALAACSSETVIVQGGPGGGGSGSGLYSGTGDPADPATPSGDPVLDDARKHCLETINAYRAKAGVAPMALDDGLNTFAQAASQQLSVDHKPHAYFAANARSCTCRVGAENQGSPNGWPAGDPNTQIDQVLAAMMREGPGGGHHDNIVSARYKRLGVGLVGLGSRLYFTNDFGQ
jgi:hypothetical protein